MINFGRRIKKSKKWGRDFHRNSRERITAVCVGYYEGIVQRSSSERLNKIIHKFLFLLRQAFMNEGRLESNSCC